MVTIIRMPMREGAAQVPEGEEGLWEGGGVVLGIVIVQLRVENEHASESVS